MGDIPVPKTIPQCLSSANDVFGRLVESAGPDLMVMAFDFRTEVTKRCNDGQLEVAQRLMVDADRLAKEMGPAKWTSDSKQPERKPCFLTASCCELVGLADDCFELRTLRRYRDEVLADMPGGRGDIERYYGIAPVILASIRRKGRERELLALYFTHILPSAMLARVGFNRTARRLYTHMMSVLCRRHIPDATKPMALA